MLEKAGYMQKAKAVTIDEEGLPTEIIELVIDGKRFGIVLEDLNHAIRGKISARTFQLRLNWKQYVSTTAGLAYLSYSGKALNIELMDGNRYTVSLDSLKSLLCRRSSYAPVARLPMSSAIKYPSILGDTQSILATC
ncbi:hypothetical protein Mhun_0792 [Methanospirillum hungatei JF-1]|uniref:Uncharacterized protein n=2 Tax=Methanospirillum hungatei TaxID=2203 RepID=Q2FUB6_METHJ|nr:hypothetical protein Mhun_0792 [Methanospirillum hungatei JF-1]